MGGIWVMKDLVYNVKMFRFILYEMRVSGGYYRMRLGKYDCMYIVLREFFDGCREDEIWDIENVNKMFRQVFVVEI